MGLLYLLLPRLGGGWGGGASQRIQLVERWALTRFASLHSRCFASAFLALRTAAEGRLCSPASGGGEGLTRAPPGKRFIPAGTGPLRRAPRPRWRCRYARA